MLRVKISTMIKPCYKCVYFYKDRCMFFCKFTINFVESTNSNISLLVKPEIASKIWETKCGPNGTYFVGKY